jgi:small subunit ribosomal protein S6
MNYELMLILKPDVSEEEQKAKTEKIKQTIKDANGEVIKEEAWGRRNLAYPIKHFAEGLYHLLFIKLPASSVGELRRKLRLEGHLLRFMVVRTD